MDKNHYTRTNEKPSAQQSNEIYSGSNDRFGIKLPLIHKQKCLNTLYKREKLRGISDFLTKATYIPPLKFGHLITCQPFSCSRHCIFRVKKYAKSKEVCIFGDRMTLS